MSSRSSPISPRKMIAILWTSMLALLCLVPVVQAESLQSGVYVIDKPGPSGQGGRQLYLAVNGSDITGYYSYALSRQYDASLPPIPSHPELPHRKRHRFGRVHQIMQAISAT